MILLSILSLDECDSISLLEHSQEQRLKNKEEVLVLDGLTRSKVFFARSLTNGLAMTGILSDAGSCPSLPLNR